MGIVPCYAPSSTAPGALVWEAGIHLVSGRNYRFSITAADLVDFGQSPTGPTTGSDGITHYDPGQTRFSLQIWLRRHDNTHQAVQLLYSYSGYVTTNSVQVTTPYFQRPPGTADDWDIGVDIVKSSSGGSSTPSVAYFGLDNAIVEEMNCGPAAPQLLSTTLTQCGTAPLTFTITAPSTLPSGQVYKWYTKDASGAQQVLAPSPTTANTFTIAMPTGATLGVPYTFYVAIVNTNATPNIVGTEVAVQATWYEQVTPPVIGASAPILLVGHIAGLGTSPQPGVQYSWSGPGISSAPGNVTTFSYMPTAADAGVGSITYSVTATGAGNCSATSDPLNLPVFVLAPGDQAACAPATITVQLPALPGTGYTYRWYTGASGGSPIAGAGATYTVPYSAVGAYLFYVCIANTTSSAESERLPVQLTWYPTAAPITLDAAYSGVTPYLQGDQLRFVAPAGYDTYIWHWDDGSPDDQLPATGYAVTHSFAQAGTHTVTLTVNQAHADVAGGSCGGTSTLAGLVIIAPLCEVQVATMTGAQFQKNNCSGAVSYVAPAGTCVPPVTFECLSERVIIPHVVAASATAFAAQLVPASSPAPVAGTAAATPYLLGQWRTLPQASYTYRTSLDPVQPPATAPLNYTFGTFTLRAFDWESSLRARPAAWLTAAVTEQASANGDVLQERDPLGIASTAKFGYGVSALVGGMLTKVPGRILPYLQAHNAEASAVLFESFENTYSSNGATLVEDGLALPADVQVIACTPTQAAACFAHTGNGCAYLANRQLSLLPIPLTSQLNGSGLLIKVWVRVQDYAPDQFNANVRFTTATTVTTIPLTTSIRTGEWLLFEARVALNGLASLGERLTPVLQFSSTGGSAVWVDDVRVQPAEAQMTAYVYDPVSLRLVASFDDQHFALLYQYNQEGKLIRKLAETTRGIKTLQETQYHTPTTDQVND